MGLAAVPLATRNFSRGRLDFVNSLTAEEVDRLAADPRLEVLHTRTRVEPSTWDLLNDRLFSQRPEVDLRVYGYAGYDLSFVRRLPNVRRFLADCLIRARGVENVASFPDLEKLSVGIYELESFDFLTNLPDQRLQDLSLHATKSKKPTLRHLERYKHLRTLYLEGQKKEIEAISSLPRVEDLTLRSITVPGLNFLKGLERLWSLDIKLGGINNLSALEGDTRIKYLELWQIRGLVDIAVISTMRALEHLFLQSLAHIRSLPDLSKLRALRRIDLTSMKGLVDLHALTTAPALEELCHFDAAGIEPEQYADLLRLKTLKRLTVGLGSQKKNEIVAKMAAQAGVRIG
jgi:hypothetical protein